MQNTSLFKPGLKIIIIIDFSFINVLEEWTNDKLQRQHRNITEGSK